MDWAKGMVGLCAALLCACEAAPSTPASPGVLAISATLGQIPAPAESLSLSKVEMHLSQIKAISDLAGEDPRASVVFGELHGGEQKTMELAQAPSGLYSAVVITSGQLFDDEGIEFRGTLGGRPIAARVGLGDVTLSCPRPQALGPNGRVELAISIDPARWFDSLALDGIELDDGHFELDSSHNDTVAKQLAKNASSSLSLDCTTVDMP